MVHFASPHRVPLLQAAGRVVATLQEDQCQGLSAACGRCGTGRCSRLGWAAVKGGQAHRAAFPACRLLCCSFRMSSRRFICRVSSWGADGPRGSASALAEPREAASFPQALEVTIRVEGALGREPVGEVWPLPARKGLKLGLGPQQRLQLPWFGTHGGVQGCRELQMRALWDTAGLSKVGDALQAAGLSSGSRGPSAAS